MQAQACEVFFSYAPEDEPLQIKLEKHLAILKREGVITGWHKRLISPGKEWQKITDEHLETAHIILLLVSSDFLASEYHYSKEMARAMQRHEAGTARVIPIILRASDWRNTSLAQFQVLPTDARPVKMWQDEDDFFLNVAQGIRTAVQEIIGDRNPPLPQIKHIPILSVMGTNGGVGKGTFVSCTSQLIADRGYDIAIIDFDLDNAGTTKTSVKLFGKNNPPVKTAFDHFAPHAGARFQSHQGTIEESLWDITPVYLRERKRGEILLVPAADSSSYKDGWDVIADVSPPREQKLKELTQEIVERIKREYPSVRCILIDCGAGMNPIFSAAFASANYGYIITRPQEQYFDTIPDIHELHKQRFSQQRFQRIFTVVNRITSPRDRERCAGLHPKGYIPDSPTLQADAFRGGSIDYDLGYNNVFLAICQCLAETFNAEHQPLIPDEVEVRIKPWWSRFVKDKLAERILRSPAFRIKTLLAWSCTVLSTIALIILIVLNMLPKFLSASAQVQGQLDVILFFILLAILIWSVRWLIRQEKRRRLLQRIARMQPEDESPLLAQLLTQADRASLRWLNQLLTIAQEKETSRRIASYP